MVVYIDFTVVSNCVMLMIVFQGLTIYIASSVLKTYILPFIFSGVERIADLVSAVMQRTGHVSDGERPLIMVCLMTNAFALYLYVIKLIFQFPPSFQYEDDEGDKIYLATDNDLATAVTYARSAGIKVKLPTSIRMVINLVPSASLGMFI